MNNKFYLAVILAIVIGVGLFVFSSGGEDSGGNVVSGGDVNEITIGMKNYNYYPNAVNVKYGETVRIYLDNSVGGCFRDFVIRDFGVREYLMNPTDYVEFVADKRGTFTFACSMGMGVGKLVVE